MSLTSTQNHLATPGSAPPRAAVGSAVLFAVTIFMTVAVVNVPHAASDSELLSWWQQQSNRTAGVLSGLFAITTAALFAVFTNQVHHSEAARHSPLLRAWSQSMGGGFVAAMLVTAATRSAVGHLVDVMDEPLPGVDVLRYATALNYQVLGLAAMGALGLTMLSMSVLAIRTGVYGRWAAWVGAGCGTLTVLSVAAGFGSFTVPLAVLWSVCVGIALRRSSTMGGVT